MRRRIALRDLQQFAKPDGGDERTRHLQRYQRGLVRTVRMARDAVISASGDEVDCGRHWRSTNAPVRARMNSREEVWLKRAGRRSVPVPGEHPPVQAGGRKMITSGRSRTSPDATDAT